MSERLCQIRLALPDVREVGLAGNGIEAGNTQTSGIYVRGEAARGHGCHTQPDTVSPEYLHAVGTTLLKGAPNRH